MAKLLGSSAKLSFNGNRDAPVCSGWVENGAESNGEMGRKKDERLVGETTRRCDANGRDVGMMEVNGQG